MKAATPIDIVTSTVYSEYTLSSLGIKQVYSYFPQWYFCVIVIHWVTRNYGSKRTDPEGEVCLRRHNSLATSESLLPEAIQNAGRQGYAFST